MGNRHRARQTTLLILNGSNKMKLGCFGALSQAQKIKDAGFDYLEINVQDVLKGHQASTQWDKDSPNPNLVPIPIQTACFLLPDHLQVIGENRCPIKLQDYIQRVAKRAEKLGIKSFIFGSGMARHRDQGVDPLLADLQIQEFVDMAGQICKHHNIDFIVAHLSCTQTNMLNTLEEVKNLCKKINHKNVLAMVDHKQYLEQKEPESSILDIAQLINHIYVRPLDENPPSHQDYLKFFTLLRKIDYDGRITVTTQHDNITQEQRTHCVQMLRQAWQQACRCDS